MLKFRRGLDGHIAHRNPFAERQEKTEEQYPIQGLQQFGALDFLDGKELTPECSQARLETHDLKRVLESRADVKRAARIEAEDKVGADAQTLRDIENRAETKLHAD